MSTDQPIYERIKSDSLETLLDTISRFPNTAEGTASKAELDRRNMVGSKAHHEHVTELLGSMKHELKGIHGHAKRPEYKSFSFWLAVLGVMVAILAFLRDSFDWKFPFPSQKANATTPQQHDASPSSERAIPELPPSSTNVKPSEESKLEVSPLEAKTSPCESLPGSCD
jgi:hypothetical protein